MQGVVKVIKRADLPIKRSFGFASCVVKVIKRADVADQKKFLFCFI